MLPENLQWYFPKSLREASKLISQPGVILHAGGTRILKTDTKSIKALVDIGKLELRYIIKKKNKIHIGTGSTFNDIVDYYNNTGELKLLADSLHQSASMPLRNRITIGGSLKDFPLWSSLYAPLIVMNAKIKITGAYSGEYLIEDYISQKLINKKHLIKEVIIEQLPNTIFGVRRFSQIKFEYPLFNIAVLFIVTKNKIKDSRLCITGVQERYKRFKRAENIFTNNELTDETIEKAMKFITPKFNPDYKFSAEYKKNVARVYFNDLLTELKEKI